jgi:predicted SprT family Zn-dependent metalloprotease
MKEFESALSHHESTIQREVDRLCELWDISSIRDDIDIEFTSRLTRSLGRTHPAKKNIRLNRHLLANLVEYLEEVLCHEVGHIATFYKFGDSVSPHGEEWQSLVRLAGFEPTTKLDVALEQSEERSKRQFSHSCPRCFTKRIAKVRMTRWRCGTCVAEGMEGNLLIEEVL